MRKALVAGVSIALVLALPILAGDEGKRPPTEQIQRGHDLFTKPAKGVACATCHRLAGEGTAIGPDLSVMGSMGTSHVIVMTMRMTMTNYVQSFKTVDGKFPGMLKNKDTENSEIWDLSQMPPALRKLANRAIQSVERDQTWKHPPASVDYSSQEFADLIAFLRWGATGATAEVKTSEVADFK